VRGKTRISVLKRWLTYLCTGSCHLPRGRHNDAIKGLVTHYNLISIYSDPKDSAFYTESSPFKSPNSYCLASISPWLRSIP